MDPLERLALVLDLTVYSVYISSDDLGSLNLASRLLRSIAAPKLFCSLGNLELYGRHYDLLYALRKGWQNAMHVWHLSLKLDLEEDCIQEKGEIVTMLPKLQYLELSFTADVLYDVNYVLNAMSFLASLRELTLISPRPEMTIGHVTTNDSVLQMYERLGLGLEELNLVDPGGLGQHPLERLLTACASSLRRLGLCRAPRHNFKLDGFLFPALESLEITELYVARGPAYTAFLRNHPLIKKLVCSGYGTEDELRYCPSLRSLTLDAELSVLKISHHFKCLPMPSMLCEVHVSLAQGENEILLADAFRGLQTLERLSISGWYIETEMASGFAADGTWPILSQPYLNPENIFPSLKLLEIYYMPLRLVALPAHPILDLDYLHDQNGLSDSVMHNEKYLASKASIEQWRTIVSPHVLLGMQAFAGRSVIQRIRWVPCSHGGFDDDIDIIIERERNTLPRIRGGFSRKISTDTAAWKRKVLLQSSDYDGPWERTWD